MTGIEHSLDKHGLYYGVGFFLILLVAAGGARQLGLVLTHDEPTPAIATQFAEGQTGQGTTARLDTTLPLAPRGELVADMPNSPRVINALTIAEVVPAEGKFIAADLEAMKIYLYQNGSSTAEYPILTKGRPSTPWETPAGLYSVKTKEKSHFSSIGKVYMPYSMQIFGNYFIHGWTYYPDGTPVAASFSGGCIKLSTDDAQSIFAFADIGTEVFVYEPTVRPELPPIALGNLPAPTLTAQSYLVADLDSGDVYLEKNAQTKGTAGPATTLMTALVANEVISFDKKLTIAAGSLATPQDPENITPLSVVIGDLLYPLIMQSNDLVAHTLASYHGVKSFVSWMNNTAKALNMSDTTFAEPGTATESNQTTVDDLFRLTAYLAHKKSFVLSILGQNEKTIKAVGGESVPVINEMLSASSTLSTAGALVTVWKIPSGGTDETRRVAVIVTNAQHAADESQQLAHWLTRTVAAAQSGTAACANCATKKPLRKIELGY